DVGVNRVTEAGGRSRIVGDVAFAEGSEVAGALKPGPGGVGPRTIACLLADTVRAARAQARLRGPSFWQPPTDDRVSSRVARSAGPGEGDFVEGAGAEPFGGTRHRLAAERPIEADGRLVVRERPDHQALQPTLHQVAPRRGEQLAAEAETLEFRPQVELVDFAVVIQAARAVAPVIGITGHAFPERQHHDPAAFANRAVPPQRAAPVDELVELRPGNDALISTPPGFVVRRGDGRCIGRLGAADFDEGRAHDMIEASTRPRFKSYV